MPTITDIFQISPLYYKIKFGFYILYPDELKETLLKQSTFCITLLKAFTAGKR